MTKPRESHPFLEHGSHRRLYSDEQEQRLEANGSGNGAVDHEDEVRVAIVGVGNCASSFVQGVEYYKDADPADFVPGLMHVDLGGYHVRDIKFTAAFDIDADKVGKDLSEAIWRGQNNTMKFSDVPKLGVEVQRGMTHDGLGKYLKEKIQKAPGETADIASILRETQTDVLVSYLPVGSEEATKWYVEQALAAGCGFVNCIPVFIAREAYWQKRFKKAGLPIIGDDIKSQVGATIVHRTLARLFGERGVRIAAHQPAERRRQHGLLQHARARAAGVQEDLEDERRHVDPRPRAARRRRLHRPVGLRAVARRTASGRTSGSRASRSAACR